MSTAATKKAPAAIPVSPALAKRILDEGYGPGAWHGNDMKAALADVTPKLAYWRPAPGRHSIAEIAIHHAFYQHSVRGRLTGAKLEPFVLEGDDWFVIDDEKAMAWKKIVDVVESMQKKLAAIAGDGSILPEDERLGLLIGITCHAVYHAGQVQLIKALAKS